MLNQVVIIHCAKEFILLVIRKKKVFVKGGYKSARAARNAFAHLFKPVLEGKNTKADWLQFGPPTNEWIRAYRKLLPF